MSFLMWFRFQIVQMQKICNLTQVGILLVIGLLSISASAQSNANFKINHYSMSIGQDGVKRETSYSENLYRNGSEVIYKRDLPTTSHKKEIHNHRHFNSAISPQLVTLTKSGEVNFAFLDIENKTRIEVSKLDFNSVGFSGSWPGSYSLIDPAIFKSMVKKGTGPSNYSIWYEQVGDKGTTRILWDDKNKIALEVEVISKDGLMKKRTTSKLVNMNEIDSLFSRVKSFEMKVIADYRD